MSIAIALIQVAAPSLLTGVGGAILAHLQNPLAAGVLKLGKRLLKGDHLSEEDKQFIHEYNKTHGVGSPGYHPSDTYR